MPRCLIVVLVSLLSGPADAAAPTTAPATVPAGFRIYAVDRRVSDLPDKEDYSTLEAAYATIERRIAAGTDDAAFWASVSCREPRERSQAEERNLPLAQRLARKLIVAATTQPKAVPPDVAKRRLGATIVEARIFRDMVAAVFAQWDNGTIDIRHFRLEDGKWRNAGNDRAVDLERARWTFALVASRQVEKPKRPPVADPAAALKPYVEYLRKAGHEPKSFVLDAVANHNLTIIGEIHHRPTYWALNTEIVSDPCFANTAGTIYLELPSHGQALVDRFLAAEKLDTAPVIEMLRDMMIMGWPDQAMLDFFVAVWNTNQKLPAKDRLRIVLVDMARPWSKIQKPADWQPYETDRDQLMADNILKDLKMRGEDPRHALFIVGYAHVEMNLPLAADRSMSYSPTAGGHLRKALGGELYTLMQHGPVLANMGGVNGRAALGLFDSAFAALDHKPVAFALAGGPFGAVRFDADADKDGCIDARYDDAFDGYLYLGPVEKETFSSLILDFYTDDFAKELDRRSRMMGGRGLAAEGMGVDGKSIERWMGASWGKPRDWTGRLGPIDGWRDGDDWQEAARQRATRNAAEHPEIIRDAARKLLESIRDADYRNPSALWKLDYCTDHHFDLWINWVCDRFGKAPIRKIELGEVKIDGEGRPAVAYALTLSDGSKLAGVLPCRYQPLTQAWEPMEGLDWHLKPATQPASRP